MNEHEAAVWMSRLVEHTSGEGALPDPALIWWKAQLLEKRAANARVTRPVAIAQWVSLVVTVVTTIGLCAANWAGIKGVLEPFGPALWVAFGGAVILMLVALPLVSGGASFSLPRRTSVRRP